MFRFVCVLMLVTMAACQQPERPESRQVESPAPVGDIKTDVVTHEPAAVSVPAAKPAAPKAAPKQAARLANSVAKEQKIALKPATPEKLASIAGPKPEKATAAMTGDAARGKKIARGKCGGCHYFDRERKKVGPGLQGVYGRAPSIDGIPFARWDAKALDAWLTRPKAVKPKTRMSFRGLASKQDRDDVIAYLKTL